MAQKPKNMVLKNYYQSHHIQDDQALEEEDVSLHISK